MSSKVLVVGSVRGQGRLRSVFAKIGGIHGKNGPFSFAVIVGDVFDGCDNAELDELLNGTIKVPLECFCSVGRLALPERVRERINERNGEIAPNLVFLGKHGSYTTASGLRIATFGGEFDLDGYTTEDIGTASGSYTASAHASFLGSLKRPVDILLTHEWPAQITHLSTPPSDPDAALWGVPSIAELVHAARPKYHFASGKAIFWERAPFTWPAVEGVTDVSRFISLGDFANETKERWYYAMSLDPPSAPAKPVPANATLCPLPQPKMLAKAKRPLDDAPPNFLFSTDMGPAPPPKRGRSSKRGRGGGNQAAQRPIGPDTCWFCLSNPSVAKHLIVSIGTEVYLALPKGQIPVTNDGSCSVPGGGHVLIIPIAHSATFSAMAPDQRKAIEAEVDAYKAALRTMYAAYDSTAVVWEVSRGSRAGHAHVQVCPVPNELAPQIEVAFQSEADRLGYAYEQDADAALAAGIEHFRVELPDGRQLVHAIDPGARFDLQFGRGCTAALLNMADRVDWKACALDDASEREQCAAFKRAFAKFDPST